MPESIYLNDQSKSYYLADFNKVLAIREGYQKVAESVIQPLKQINDNLYIQTLYYSKYKFEDGCFYPDAESYLELAYAYSIEHQLRNCLKAFKGYMYSLNATVQVEGLNPSENILYDPESNYDIGCYKNPDYFRLKHFRITLESSDPLIHDEFFLSLAKRLSVLK